MEAYIATHWLDILTTILGLVYIWLEYRASIWLWLVGIVMPALDIWLYWSHGLYGDAGMACYYTVAAIYGLIAWRWGNYLLRWLKKDTGQPTAVVSQAAAEVSQPAAEVPSSADGEVPITHMPLRLYLPTAVCFFVLWIATYYVLVTWTNSTVPVLDSFTNALSFVGLWALARKYVEQWWFWIAVDVVCCVLYIQKGIPFKAGLYGLYVAIAVAGWFKWQQLMKQQRVK